MLIGDIVRNNGRRFPNKPAVVFGNETITWSMLDDRAGRVAAFLLNRGMRPGDRVAILAQNTSEWPELTYGLAKAGLVVVPVNARLAPSEVEFLIQDSGARAAFVHHDQLSVLEPALPHLELVVELRGSEQGLEYEQILADTPPLRGKPALVDTDLYSLMYTSGTTGRPKAVMLDHRAMMAQVLDTSIVTQARPDDVMLAMTPFFSAGGMTRTLSWMYLGQTMVIHPKFDPEAALYAIERHRVTMTTFIPTMLVRTLNVLEQGPPTDVSSLRRISYGSSPSPIGLATRAMELLGCDLQQRYGLTEVGSQVTILTPEDHRAMVQGKESLRTSCGRETAQAEIRVVNDDGNDAGLGTIGEIVIRADSNGRGYWNRPDETASTFRPEGVWSGDLGRLDDDGYLHIEGRKTDMIVSGGFNVYPAELERVIQAHPGVELVAVVGAPHETWGETPIAIVVAREDTNSERLGTELREQCRKSLAGYKQPSAIEFRNELPLGPAGKILKRELRNEQARLQSASGR